MRRFFLKLSRRRRLDRELEAELAFHREMAEASGNPIPLGNTSRIKEASSDLWHFTSLENLWRDFVYGARGLRRNPALVITAVLSLALGIGANTAIFSLAVQFLFSRPSVTDPKSVVYARVAGNSNSPKQVLDFIRRSGAFVEVAGVNEESFINWNNGEETRPIYTVTASKNFFSSLGVPVALGRGILPDDPDQVVVINDRFWRTRFQADRGIVGRTIRLDGKPYTVVGVLPPDHRTMAGYGLTPDAYVPQYLADTTLEIYLRLKPGMSVQEARAALLTIATRMDAAMPMPYKYTDSLRVTPITGFRRLLGDSEARTIGVFFMVVLGMVGLVLLIACVNVAGLLLARASARKREIATRLALGASRGRLFQQLLTESVLLSIGGAACGLGLAWTVMRLLSQIRLPIPFPIYVQSSVDWRAAVYAAVLTAVATLACGLLPARQAVKESIAPDLRREQRLWLRRALVTAQIAVSLVVLSTGLLFVHNLLRSSAMSPGFDIRHTVRATVDLPPRAYGDGRSIALFAERALQELNGIPGVEGSAAARVIPFMDATRFGGRIGFPGTADKINVFFYWNVVTQDYFKAMGIGILQGRSFLPGDLTGEQVVVINRTFAARHLGGRAPVGATFLWGPNGKTVYRIVGVVETTKNYTIGEDDQPQVYQYFEQLASIPSLLQNRVQFVIRSATPPAAQLDAIRKTLRGVEPSAGLEVATLYSSVGLAFLPGQVGAALMGSAGLLGLLLASIGLYGTMVYWVARRTREIGLRLALGATRGDISRMILLGLGQVDPDRIGYRARHRRLCDQIARDVPDARPQRLRSCYFLATLTDLRSHGTSREPGPAAPRGLDRPGHFPALRVASARRGCRTTTGGEPALECCRRSCRSPGSG